MDATRTLNPVTKWPDHFRTRFGQERPRKLLALDGGGIRGVLTLEILAEMERQIKAATGQEKLGEYFDYIGGTSTGAIIAAGLSIGMSAQQLLEFYETCGTLMFEKTTLIERVATLMASLYKSEPLTDKLKSLFTDAKNSSGLANLDSDRVLCLLLVVTKNITTDSAWPVSNNPFAKYNNPDHPECNLHIPLWQLVRASTAAPVFFPPEVVPLNPNKTGNLRVFVDGGITPYNNPAFLLFRMATQPAYNLNWKLGEENLLLISVGTGAARNKTNATSRNFIGNMETIPGALMDGIQVEQDINCRTVGRCVHGAEIDREIESMVLPESSPAGKFFRYARYNADLSAEGLKALDAKLGALRLNDTDRVGDMPADAVQKMDAVDQINNLRKIGRAVARTELDVKAHFGPFLK